MAYLTSTYLDEALGSDKVTALTPTSAERDRLIAQAEAECESALLMGGYSIATPPSAYDASASDCPEVVKLAAFGAWLELAYGRNDLELPEVFGAYVRKIDDIRAGKIEINGVTKATARAVGGVLFSDSTSGLSTSRPARFGRGNMGGF